MERRSPLGDPTGFAPPSWRDTSVIGCRSVDLSPDDNFVQKNSASARSPRSWSTAPPTRGPDHRTHRCVRTRGSVCRSVRTGPAGYATGGRGRPAAPRPRQVPAARSPRARFRAAQPTPSRRVPSRPARRSGSSTRSPLTARTGCTSPIRSTSLPGPAMLCEVRRFTWNAARWGGMSAHARDLQGARYALWKNPEVRHEAPLLLPGGGERTPPLACRSRLVKLRAA
jgi:hypothetical protein